MSKSIQDEIMDLKEQGLSWVQIATRLNLASMKSLEVRLEVHHVTKSFNKGKE